MSLTACERETVILWSDDDDYAFVTTYQAKMLRALRDNPAAELLEELKFGTSRGGIFKVPKSLVSVRKPRQISESTRAKLAQNLVNARQARSRKG